MFVTKDEIRRIVRQVINDDKNNDIVFIIANKGFGKYRLLKEISGHGYQKNTIVVSGSQFHSDSVVKNCLMQAIYEFINRNNTREQRHRLCKLIAQAGKFIPVSHKIWFEFHVKLTCAEVEQVLECCTLKMLTDIYKDFSFNSPLVFFIHGVSLGECDRAFLSTLNVETNTAKFTYIITLRPNNEGVSLIKSVLENRKERVWICPLIPTIRKSDSNSEIISIPSITLDGIIDKGSYSELKSEILRKDCYNQVFDTVEELQNSGVNPSMIFATATLEICKEEFEYINSLAVRLLDETKASPNYDVLLSHDGKYMWIDTLAHYLFVNEKIKDIVLELQNFYFAILTNINDWKMPYSDLLVLNVAPKKKDRIRIGQFLKDTSEMAENPVVPELTQYISQIATWICVYSKPTRIDKSFSCAVDSLVDDLHLFNIGFSDINLRAMQIVCHETCCLGALDIGLLAIAKRICTASSLTKKEVGAINSLVSICFNEMLRWNDITLAREVCDVLELLDQNGMIGRYQVPAISNNHAMYRYLSNCMKKKNIEIGEIIMGRKTVFISYTAADNDVVDIVDDFLMSCGYDVKRDTRNIDDYDSIEMFMKEIREQDFVVPIVSDSYLRRDNCMYEITQLLKNDDYSKRTFPVVVDLTDTPARTYGFFSPQYRIEIISYWEMEAKRLETEIEKLSLANKVEMSMEFRRISNYAQTVSELLGWIKNMKVGVVRKQKSSSSRKKEVQEIAAVIAGKMSNTI